MSAKPSTNDSAWQALFEKQKILEEIEIDGCFYISSKIINQQRESRLMTKFDHQVERPKLFRDNNLSIQPVSRGGYVIGHFSSYFSLPEDRTLPEIQYFEFPSHIETIVPQQISSESSAILCAYLSGMLTDILEEETLFTVFGRMSTGQFDYEIHNSRTSQGQNLKVNNAQCEIDGGFEGTSKFAIIEAKCQSVDDFIIRQLYYPYRLWQSKTGKEVVPILLLYSNNIFTFYVFEFCDLYQYNSIHLNSIHRYCIGQYEIDLSEIKQVLSKIECFEDENIAPFPQADRFVRVIDLLDKLYIHEDPLTKDEITTEYAFNVRQTDYYISAGIYLGLFKRVLGSSGYILTDKGKTIVKLDPKTKNLELVKAILSHKVFNMVLSEYLANSEKPDREEIVKIMSNNLDNLRQATIERRAQTVEKWIDWILQLTST